MFVELKSVKTNHINKFTFINSRLLIRIISVH